MFEDNLSAALLRLLEEKEISQEKLAESSNLSFRYINKIIGRKASPTITSLEKICSALEITPNELLLTEDFNNSVVKSVITVKQIKKNGKITYQPICPHCGKLLKSENIVFCNHCSGKLSWQKYSGASVVTCDNTIISCNAKGKEKY